jgi:hypothetical protein
MYGLLSGEEGVKISPLQTSPQKGRLVTIPDFVGILVFENCLLEISK